MKLDILVFFFATVGALTRPGPPLISKRVLRVAPAANHSLYKLSSNTGIPNHGICAKYCKSEECLSFSYTVGEQTCETYSRLIEEASDADIAMSTMYFSRVVLRSCADVPHMYHSGVYKITTTEQTKLDVYCDMDTADGPWTVIHRRTKGDVDFYRKWADYKKGFGDIHGDFWIGNDNLHLLTNTSRKLRVELKAWDGTWGYAEYTNFQVADETQNYKLLVNGFSGNVSYNAMEISNGRMFTTIDRDHAHDPYYGNCAAYTKSGWWHRKCVWANLNGVYHTLADMNTYQSYQTYGVEFAMRWAYFPYPTIARYPLEKAKMMIR